MGFRKCFFLGRAGRSLPRVHPTSAVITLSLPLVCCFFHEHSLKASSVPGTLRALIGALIPSTSTEHLTQSPENSGLGFFLAEARKYLLSSDTPPFPGSTLGHPSEDRGLPLTPPAPAARPQGLPGDCTSLWPSFGLPLFLPHLQSQPREARCPALRPRCCGVPQRWEGLT